MSRPPADALTPVVTDVVERAGFVLDDLEVRPVGRRRLVRVVVDTSEVPGPDDGPSGGVDLDAVAGISRDVSAAVDAHEESEGAVLDGAYTLEVTTPGADRPLTRPHHWRRAWLRAVAVTRTDGGEVTGRVGPVDDAGASVTLAVDGGLYELPLDDVARAVVQIEFKPAPAGEVDALRAAHAGVGEQEEERG